MAAERLVDSEVWAAERAVVAMLMD